MKNIPENMLAYDSLYRADLPCLRLHRKLLTLSYLFFLVTSHTLSNAPLTICHNDQDLSIPSLHLPGHTPSSNHAYILCRYDVSIEYIIDSQWIYKNVPPLSTMSLWAYYFILFLSSYVTQCYGCTLYWQHNYAISYILALV